MVPAGVANTAAEATRLAAENSPDVVIMDFHLKNSSGAQAANQIRSASPQTVFLFYSADNSDEVLLEAVEAGASGYLSKGSHPDLILDAVRRVAVGDMLIPSSLLVRLINSKRAAVAASAAKARVDAQFTAREREMLILMREGLDNAAMSARLFIELSTVRWHVRHILDKLGAHSKLEAVAKAAELGLLGE
jgi:DNA-binding NarL/FixJ family response regulator